MYEDIRIVIEVASAIICFILVWFMVKPYSLTREVRYLGLPLGFGFLGIGSVISAIATATPGFFNSQLAWLQLLPRTFAFLFLAVTYYFSKKPSRKSRFIWNSAISLLLLSLLSLVLLLIINPQFATMDSYFNFAFYFRVCNLICLFYISIHTLLNHIKTLETSTIVIPFGFILMGISQYSIMIFSIDRSYFAFWGTIVLRFASFAAFLYVSCKAFHCSGKQGVNDEKETS